MTVSPEEKRLNWWWCRLGCGLRCVQEMECRSHTWAGNIESEKGPAQDMSDGRYTQSDSAGGSTDTVRMLIGAQICIKYSRFITCQSNTSKGRGHDHLPNW